MPTTPKHRLRWYQYSLRSLLVLTVLVAIGGSWFAWKKQQVERQRAAVRAIKELGGASLYDWELDDITLGKQGAGPPPGPVWLRSWIGDNFFAHVVVVLLYDTRIPNAGLERLRDLPQIKELNSTEPW